MDFKVWIGVLTETMNNMRRKGKIMGPLKYIGKLITIPINFPVLTFVLFTHMHTNIHANTTTVNHHNHDNSSEH